MIEYKGVSLEREQQLLLRDVNLHIGEGEFVYLIGKVGSGKSSFLKSLYAEIPILEGKAQVFDYDLRHIKRSQIPYLRRRLGIIFQDFQLLVDRTVKQNLEFVLKATGWKSKKEREKRIEEVLQLVGMENKGYRMPNTLSGGEQQRVVIARALLNNPSVILADEPTGNLDPETGSHIVQLLYDICHQHNTTVLMSTHNLQLLEQFPGRVLRLVDCGIREDNAGSVETSDDESLEETLAPSVFGEDNQLEAPETEAESESDSEPESEPEPDSSGESGESGETSESGVSGEPSEEDQPSEPTSAECLSENESAVAPTEAPIEPSAEEPNETSPATESSETEDETVAGEESKTEEEQPLADEPQPEESHCVEVQVEPIVEVQSDSSEAVPEGTQSDLAPDLTDSSSVADHCSPSGNRPVEQNCNGLSGQIPSESAAL